MEETFTIYLVDDDPGVLKGLSRLLRARGFEVQSFASAGEFLCQHDPAIPGCAILDVAMPDLDGIELQEALIAADTHRPVVFLTGRGDIPMSVRAMRAGAVDFLTKPVSDEALLDAVGRARESDARSRDRLSELNSIQTKVRTLTPREREVLAHVVAGRLNKQIAGDLGTVEKTIKVHRSRMMVKLGVRTVADLVRMAEKVGVTK